MSRVLIVDRSAESRDVLRTLLERSGVTIVEARGPRQAIEVAEQFQPNLILLDAESDWTPQGSAAKALLIASGCNDTPIVILGTVRHGESRNSAAQIIAKPYHYGQLIRKIEGLLAAA